jgi:hypothetical protein
MQLFITEKYKKWKKWKKNEKEKEKSYLNVEFFRA